MPNFTLFGAIQSSMLGKITISTSWVICWYSHFTIAVKVIMTQPVTNSQSVIILLFHSWLLSLWLYVWTDQLWPFIRKCLATQHLYKEIYQSHDPNFNKLAPCGTGDLLFAMDGPCQLQSRVTQKLDQISKSGLIKFRYSALF